MAAHQLSLTFTDAAMYGVGGLAGGFWIRHFWDVVSASKHPVPPSLVSRATNKEWYISKRVADAIVKADPSWEAHQTPFVGNFVVNGETGQSILVGPALYREEDPNLGLFPVRLTSHEATCLGVVE